MYPCHSQTVEMATMAFFIEVPEWQWHYNPALDSLYMTTLSRMHLYLFFQRPFIVSVVNLVFNPVAIFDGIPLHLAHSVAASPQPSLLASMEIDPFEVSTSSSSSSTSGGSRHPPSDPGPSGTLESSFLSPESD